MQEWADELKKKQGICKVTKNIGEVITRLDITKGWITKNTKGLKTDRQHKVDEIYEIIRFGIGLHDDIVPNAKPEANVYTE